MKQVIFFTATLALCLNAYSQLDNTKRKISTKETPKTLVIDNQKYIKGQKGENTAPPAQLPDLKIVSFNVNYLSTQVVDGVTKHTVEISYTIKNEGMLSLPANTVDLQGWIGYDPSYPKVTAAGGRVLSPIATEVINPGATYQGSFRSTAAFDKNNHPVYTLFLDDANRVKELNEQNNSAQMTILF